MTCSEFHEITIYVSVITDNSQTMLVANNCKDHLHIQIDIHKTTVDILRYHFEVFPLNPETLLPAVVEPAQFQVWSRL